MQGLGRFLEQQDPQAAVRISPFNVDARVRSIADGLPLATSADRLAELEAETVEALQSARIEARLFSILGEIKRLQGDSAAAERHVAQSRRLSKTEIYALERSIVLSLEDGQIDATVSDIDTLLRRWPERFEPVSKAFPGILGTEAGYAAVLKALEGGPPWRPRLFRALGSMPEGLASGERLLVDLLDAANPSSPAEIASVISGYIRQKDYQSAYRLFLFTMSEEEKEHNGYVFNSTFAPVSLGRPFDWQWSDRSGVDVVMPTASASSASGARLRFLNAPLKEIGLAQQLLLPPGSYQLSANISGRSLKLPKGLFFSVTCADGSRQELARLDLPEGSFEGRRLVAELNVPASGCGLQLLKLDTALIAESWRFRYQGELMLHEVRIEKVTA